ncbi:cation-dependent mannose-6-phosphate receptor [Mugil cephalus]|uniref:cation-dependent mannose-6-phosphate receptor n=1 Tax=Mugil cephalus TaxID=48193 RepID=UPI001FB5AD60|nr:cation-dependent mannose-6-phosphate receptor [Mugil cephalus]
MTVFNSPRRGPLVVWALTVQLVMSGSGVYATNGTKNCKLYPDSASARAVLNKLEPLSNKNFTALDTSEKQNYTYVFQLCGDAGGVKGAGVIQVDDKTKKTTVVGSYNETQAIEGSDWVMLMYTSGEKYNEHCSGENRKAYIMISCDRNIDVGPLKAIREDRDKKSNCFYLFELDSKLVCPPIQSQISTGSIILIIAFCFLAVYLIGGFLYQRLIVGAKGMEQFPNYAFWVEVGNMSADGCDFVCRSRNREEAPAYRGVTADTLEEEPEERDDHLLPM